MPLPADFVVPLLLGVLVEGVLVEPGEVPEVPEPVLSGGWSLPPVSAGVSSTLPRIPGSRTNWFKEQIVRIPL